MGARRCWECRELLPAAQAEFDPIDDADFDGDLEDTDTLEPGAAPRPKRSRARSAAGDDEHAGAAHAGAAPPTAVVAFVASDEVQAGTIAQLLSDCGIQNFAGSEEQELAPEGERRVHVQVLKRDLATAQRIIADFTAEFEPGD
jgi:hypothetical protein